MILYYCERRDQCAGEGKLSLVVLGLVMVERNKVNVVCGVSILCGFGIWHLAFGMFSRKDVFHYKVTRTHDSENGHERNQV